MLEVVTGADATPRHQWTGQRLGGDPAEAASAEWTSWCSLCGVEQTDDNELEACAAEVAGVCGKYIGTEASVATAQVVSVGCGQVTARGYHDWWDGTDPDFWHDTSGQTTLTVGCYQPPNEWCQQWYNEELHTWECISPIVIATGTDRAYKLTSAADGVLFDINGDGVKEQIAWTAAGSRVAFLARDVNGNGVIDGGKELFGNFTIPGALNGFAALAELQFAESRVRRGDISARDPLFATLLLWTDTNHNGVSEPGELRPFGEQFSSIDLAYRYHNRRDGHNNRYAWEGYVMSRTAPGQNPTTGAADAAARHRKVYDVYVVGQ